MLECFTSRDADASPPCSKEKLAQRASQVFSILHLSSQAGSHLQSPLQPTSCPQSREKACVRMTDTSITLHEQQYQQLRHILNKLRFESSARVVFLVDKNGQQIAVQGEVGNLDTTSLASLAAGNVAATGGMAQLIGEKEFPTLSHEGERESIHICIIGRVLLVVVFDERTSLGLIKLRVKQASRDLATLFEEVARVAAEKKNSAEAFFAEITDDDIDSLFN